MNDEQLARIQPPSRLQLSLTTYGLIIGIVGVLHGLAELLRGNAIVQSHSVEALPKNWPNENFYSFTSGSPVRSVLTGIPFYALGVLAITVSLTLIVLSIASLRVNKTGIVLFGVMSIAILLFGAGEGTPIAMSLPLVIATVLYIRRQHEPPPSTDPARARRIFSFFYGLMILSWVTFFPVLFIFSFYRPIPTWLFVLDFASMPIGAIGALIAAYIHDRASMNSNATPQS